MPTRKLALFGPRCRTALQKCDRDAEDICCQVDEVVHDAVAVWERSEQELYSEDHCSSKDEESLTRPKPG